MSLGNLRAHFQFGVGKQADQEFSGAHPLAGGHGHIGNRAVEGGHHAGASEIHLGLFELGFCTGKACFHSGQFIAVIADAELTLGKGQVRAGLGFFCFVQLGLGDQFLAAQRFQSLQIVGSQLCQLLFQRQVLLVAIEA